MGNHGVNEVHVGVGSTGRGRGKEDQDQGLSRWRGGDRLPEGTQDWVEGGTHRSMCPRPERAPTVVEGR